ncbi:MAG TPA: phosphohydrolase [Acidimicrobiaceae bacterium]|jgi:predicted HD phosphohydrolase|nr:phosphohydrolase [Acidimicrobiaceae bacterium]
MADTDRQQLATFTAMTEGTAEDWRCVAESSIHSFLGLPDRVVAHLRLLDGDFGGFAVDRLTHSLQTATRAEAANRDDEYVFCALMHDIGDTLGPANHADIAAAIIRPFVSEQHHWMVANHGIFQGYYFFHHLGLDRDMREQFRGHPWFDFTAEFCAEYDQTAFDPGYPTKPLEHFEPLIRSVMANTKTSIYKQS